MKRSLRVAALVTVVALIGLGAGAGLSGCGGMRGPMTKDVRAYTDDRLSRLHDELKLTSAQEPAWSAFRTNVSAQAGKAAEGIRSWREGRAPTTTIERLERGKQALVEGQGALEEILAATRTFYAVLDKTQQARFDEITRRFAPGGFGHHRRITSQTTGA